MFIWFEECYKAIVQNDEHIITQLRIKKSATDHWYLYKYFQIMILLSYWSILMI